MNAANNNSKNPVAKFNNPGKRICAPFTNEYFSIILHEYAFIKNLRFSRRVKNSIK